MAGYGQQGSLLNTQYNQQLQSWQANQNSMSSMMGGLGTVAGIMLSDKNAKTDRKPLPEGAALGAIREMPVEKWRYKPGRGDGGEHVGTYAQDFTKATGLGLGLVICRDIVASFGGELNTRASEGGADITHQTSPPATSAHITILRAGPT